MAASDKPFRNQYTLDIVFGVSNILMLLSIFWMLWQDYAREYKTEQRAFREIEVAVAQRAALRDIPSADSVKEAEAAVLAAKPSKEKDDELQKAKARLEKLQPQKELAEAHYQSAKADVDSKVSFLNIAIEEGDTEKAKRYRAELDKLNVRLLDEQAKMDAVTDQIKEAQATVTRINDPMLKATGELKKVNDRFDTQVKLALKKRWTVWDFLRTMPVINGFADPLKIQQYTINDVPIDYNFKYVTRFDRCTSCHVGIDRPTYTRASLEALLKDDPNEAKLKEARDLYDKRVKTLKEAGVDAKDIRLIPNPYDLSLIKINGSQLTPARITEFAGHPRLDLFVGSNSKHPAEKFGCSSCHYGQGSGTSFLDASHSPNDSKTRHEWKHDLGWEPAHMWDFPMLPTRFTESSCLKCHHEVTDLISSDNRTEAPKLLRGYNLIKENGCFGCHEISGWKSGNRIGPDLRLEPTPPLEDLNPLERAKAESDTDNRPGNLRKVGPSLARVSEKVSEEWIKKWLYSPSGFRPDTKMPHYYNLSTNSPDVLPDLQKKFPNTEMASIAYFLTKNSQDHLAAAAKHHGEDAEARRKDNMRLAELLTLARMSETERKEMDDIKRRLHLRKFPPLVDQTPPDYKANEDNGRILFTERGCLACHAHQATETANANLKIPALTSEALFGPSLGQIKAKLVPDQAKARKWLVQWIMDPHFHSPRSRMPVTHLTAKEATDVAAWLLAQPADKAVGAEWAKANVTEPDRADLEKLAEVYLVRMMSRADMAKFLKGELSEETAKLVKADIPQDERELYDHINDNNWLKSYLGKKAVNRLGCFGCHDIPNFDTAKSIGVGLNDWGKKAPERLAFEDIRNFYKAHYNTVPSLVENGKPVGIKDGKEPYEAFYGEQLMSHAPPREAFLNQKIRAPRSYDFNRLLAWDDRARMPKFNLSRPRRHQEEEDAAFKARIFLEEAQARESVATFVLGLTAEIVPIKSINQPTGPRLDEVKGRQILDKYNCAGCHLIRPGVYDFKLGPKTLDKLNFAADFEAREMKGRGETVFPYHHDWVGRNPIAADRLTAYGVQATFNKKETDDGVETYMILRPMEALRFADAAGKIKNIPSSKQFFVSLDDVVADPSKITSTDDLNRHFSASSPLGGAFGNLLVPYLVSRDPKKYVFDAGDSPTARASLPPSLIGQGERTQTDWLHKFLLNPTKVRKLAILRMPKFNMSDKEADALVAYFAAVTRQTNPGIGLPYPFEAIAQKEDLDGSYWQNKNAVYVSRLRDAKAVDIDGKPIKDNDGKQISSYEQRVKELTPLWEKIGKDQEASIKADLKKLEETKKSRTDQIDAKKKALKDADAAKKADLEKEIALLKQMVKDSGEEKARLEAALKTTDAAALKRQWEQQDAYAADAYRMLTSRKLCLQCHQIGSFLPSEKDKQGPPLALANDRLRPGWIVHWVDNPQRFVPYSSLMPTYFDQNVKKWQALHTGAALEQMQAARDALMNFPRISQLPINRHYDPDAPVDKK